jgi:hypothetical protein
MKGRLSGSAAAHPESDLVLWTEGIVLTYLLSSWTGPGSDRSGFLFLIWEPDTASFGLEIVQEDRGQNDSWNTHDAVGDNQG